MLVTKGDNLSLSYKTYKVKKENQVQQVVLWPTHAHTHTHKPTYTHTQCKIFKKAKSGKLSPTLQHLSGPKTMMFMVLCKTWYHFTFSAQDLIRKLSERIHQWDLCLFCSLRLMQIMKQVCYSIPKKIE